MYYQLTKTKKHRQMKNLQSIKGQDIKGMIGSGTFKFTGSRNFINVAYSYATDGKNVLIWSPNQRRYFKVGEIISAATKNTADHVKAEIDKLGGLSSFRSDDKKTRPNGCPMKASLPKALQPLATEEIYIGFLIGAITNNNPASNAKRYLERLAVVKN